MNKPCFSCKHHESRHGAHYCAAKKRDTSTARIIGTERADCWEVKRDETKLLEVGK